MKTENILAGALVLGAFYLLTKGKPASSAISGVSGGSLGSKLSQEVASLFVDDGGLCKPGGTLQFTDTVANPVAGVVFL